jgi:hypothetical protein
MMSRRSKITRALLALAATALVGGAAAPAASLAATDPGCSPTVAYDPAIMTWAQYFVAHPNPQAVRALGAGITGAGGGATANGVGPDPANPRGRNLNSVLLEYADYLRDATANSPRVRIIKKDIGLSAVGRPMAFYVVSNPININNLDGPSGDAAYWRGIRAGDIPEADGLEQAVTRPAFGWITATPHGDESAAGESIAREMYELAARTDCQNTQRLLKMDLFLQLVRNPDGHDAVTRTTAWGFDPNRDFGTRGQVENKLFVPLMNEYPGLFFIDAHQQGGDAYFFPPNEDPVHHEISDFSLSTIQNKIGPALQRVFNDQSALYRNYNQYDLFTPEYGDTVPSLIMGAAGMTYEKGNAEVYSRQVYDHYLAIDQTINVIADDKVSTTREWVKQWQDAVEQGEQCTLQPNKLVSPLHDQLDPVPADKRVCGYFYRPDQHSGDVASLISNLQEVGVKVFKLNSAVTLNGVKDYGKPAGTATLPAGTLYIPMAQGMKHWIEAVLGENPYIPYPFYYDVVTWSYGLQRGLAGDGFLTDPTSKPTDMTQIGAPDLGGAPATPSAVYAFDTDSMQGLGLVADLLDRDVNVYRATTAFDAGGKHYFTGAALVDGASLASSGVDLTTLAKARQTPVAGLSYYPAPRKQMTKPKIGLYTGAATIPSNPRYISGTDVTTPGSPGHCALSSGGSTFCEALFTLREKDKLSSTAVVPITSTQIAAGELVSGGYTALVAGSAISAGTTAGDMVKAFVNAGGRYVGYGANGATGARNSGLSNVSTNSVPSSMKTPGSTYDADFDTTDPVAWGFDKGGWIYRQTGDPMFDPASLATPFNSLTNPASTWAVRYATDLNSAASLYGQKYGLSVNATGPGLLDGRPAVVSSSLGAGHSTVIGFNPFYRAWKEQDERIVLNAAMYPTTSTLPAEAPVAPRPGPDAAPVADAAPALTQAKTQEATAALPKAKLPKVKKVKTVVQHNVERDFQLVVAKKYAARLKLAVKRAKLPAAIRRSVSYKTSGKVVTLTLRNARTDDFHDRQQWVSSLMSQVKARKIKVTLAQL